MKQSILLIILLFLTLAIKAQSKNINSVGVSLPIIWNNSYGVFYALGTRKEPEGKSKSMGVNINYNKTIYKSFFGILGIGYLNQNFKIKRPFEFDDPTNLLFSTKSYSYKSINFAIGAGYLANLNKKFLLKNSIIFSQISSYKQNYIPQFLSNSSIQNSQTNTEFINIGNMLNIEVQLAYKLSNKFSLGFGVNLPIIVKWKNDNMFFEYDFSNDSQIIAYNKSSIGSLITINYNIK
jgi:hypothetical protein